MSAGSLTLKFAVLLAGFGVCRAEARIDDSRDLTIRFGVTVPRLELEATPRESAAPKLRFKPNAPNKTFLSFAYDWFGATASAVSPVSSESERLQGESKASDYQFRFHFTHFSAEVFYQKYRGYYIENTADVDPSWSAGQPHRLLPDLSTEHVGGSFTYVFSPETYSMAAAFDQTRRQTESGGSWLANVSFNRHAFDNPDTLVPADAAPDYGDFARVRAGRLESLTLGGGGAYTLVAGSYFASAKGMLNLGSTRVQYSRTDGSFSEWGSGTQFHGKLALGYNGLRFISGASLAVDSATVNVEKTDLTFQTFDLSLFLGTRFDL